MSSLLQDLKARSTAARRKSAEQQAAASDAQTAQDNASEQKAAAATIERLPLLLKKAANESALALDVVEMHLWPKQYTGSKEDLKLAAEVDQNELMKKLSGRSKIIAEWLVAQGLRVSVRIDRKEDEGERLVWDAVILVAFGWV